jgi:hypothetical protein
LSKSLGKESAIFGMGKMIKHGSVKAWHL